MHCNFEEVGTCPLCSSTRIATDHESRIQLNRDYLSTAQRAPPQFT